MNCEVCDKEIREGAEITVPADKSLTGNETMTCSAKCAKAARKKVPRKKTAGPFWLMKKVADVTEATIAGDCYVIEAAGASRSALIKTAERERIQGELQTVRVHGKPMKGEEKTTFTLE